MKLFFQITTFIYFSLAVDCRPTICFCMRSDGMLLLLKNSSGTDNDKDVANEEFTDNEGKYDDAVISEYSFPEILEEKGSYDCIKRTLKRHGIRGRVGRSMNYTGTPAERSAVGDRDRCNFFMVYVRNVERYPGTRDIRVWEDLESAARLLRNHPKRDYKHFMDYVLNNATKFHLVKRDIYVPVYYLEKTVILMCTDVATNVLFVRNGDGSLGLPYDTWNSKRMLRQTRQLATRLMRRYGIVGSLYKELHREKRHDGQHRRIIYTFQVLVTEQRSTGVAYGPCFGGDFPNGRIIYYHFHDRLWLSPPYTRAHLQGTPFLAHFDEIYARKNNLTRDDGKLKLENKNGGSSTRLYSDSDSEENEEGPFLIF